MGPAFSLVSWREDKTMVATITAREAERLARELDKGLVDCKGNTSAKDDTEHTPHAFANWELLWGDDPDEDKIEGHAFEDVWKLHDEVVVPAVRPRAGIKLEGTISNYDDRYERELACRRWHLLDDLVSRCAVGEETDALLTDEHGRVYLAASSTRSTLGYPQNIFDAIIGNRLPILRLADDMLDDPAAPFRALQLTQSLYATIVPVGEIPEDIWVPVVDTWEHELRNAEPWTAHEERARQIYEAWQCRCRRWQRSRGMEIDPEDDYHIGPYLTETDVAVGGWLMVDADDTGDVWYVNLLDLFALDDARAVAHAAMAWTYPSHVLARRNAT